MDAKICGQKVKEKHEISRVSKYFLENIYQLQKEK